MGIPGSAGGETWGGSAVRWRGLSGGGKNCRTASATSGLLVGGLDPDTVQASAEVAVFVAFEHDHDRPGGPLAAHGAPHQPTTTRLGTGAGSTRPATREALRALGRLRRWARRGPPRSGRW